MRNAQTVPGKIAGQVAIRIFSGRTMKPIVKLASKAVNTVVFPIFLAKGRGGFHPSPVLRRGVGKPEVFSDIAGGVLRAAGFVVEIT